jgi:WD40 repeat protein
LDSRTVGAQEISGFSPVATFQFDAPIRKVTFRPGTSSLLIATPYLAKLVDVRTLKTLRIKTIGYPEAAFRDARFTSDGKLLAFVFNGERNGIGMLDVDSWRETSPRLATGEEFVERVTFSHGGERFISYGAPHHFAVWKRAEKGFIQDLEARTKFEMPKQRVRAVEYSPDGTKLAVGGDQELAVWAISKGDPQAARLKWRYTRICTALAFSSDGRDLYSLDAASRLAVYDADNGELRRWAYTPEREADAEFISRFAVLQDAILTASGAGTIARLDGKSSKGVQPIGRVSKAEEDVRSLVVSSDGKYVAFGTEKGTVLVYAVPPAGN